MSESDLNSIVNRLELKILECITNQAKSETKIANAICLDTGVVFQLITNLMSKGYIERTRRRKMLFLSKEYYYITLEGIAILEKAGRLYNPWGEIISILKNQIKKIIFN